MSTSRLAAFAASLVFTTTISAAEPTSEPRVAMESATAQVIDRINDTNKDKVCHHAGDRNGFETCTDLDRRDCRTLANGTLICETAP